MSRSGPLRSLIAGAITLAVIVVVALLLMATDTLLSVYQRLVDIAPALGAAFLVVLSAAAVATGYTVWRLLRPRPAVLPRRRTGDIPDRGDLDARIRQGEALGVATAEAASELQELDQRRAGGEIHIVLFGEASSGKSTLIQALLPDARVATDPRRGTTTAATRYRWQDNQGNAVELVDLPGFGQAEGGGLADLARDEAIRAHLVIHVCESDLTRSQFDQVEALSGFGKPVIVAINKSDRYSAAELGQIEQRINERLEGIDALAVVPVSAGGTEEVVVTTADGQTRTEHRERPTDVVPLVAQIQASLGGDRQSLVDQQQAASLQLAAHKLATAEDHYRRQQAATLVERYARRAVLGALAAVTPGTDIVIQGALATALVKELTSLYEVPVRQIDLDRFVELAGTRVGRFTSISLAVAGNALKAFPGVGTLAGGVVHAVAYGLIFDSLGRAIAACLADRAQLIDEDVIERMDQQPESDLAARAGRLARLAISRRLERD